MFKAQINTIETCGSNPGYHDALYQEHYTAYVKSMGYTTEETMAAVADVDLKKMRAEALKSRSGAYVGCLFLMMTNKRYKSARKFLHKALLAKEYPQDVLAIK